MAMQQRLWSLNALSVELCIDRRTLAKRLEGLPPVEEKKIGKRTEKRWRLNDVIEHLKNPKPIKDDALDKKIQDMTKEYLSKQLYPLIADNDTFIGTVFSNCLDEGLSREQALRQYKIASFALLSGICAITGDEDLTFETGVFIEFLQEHGDEYFIENHWPVEDLQRAELDISG
jgi:hypothetical protein